MTKIFPRRSVGIWSGGFHYGDPEAAVEGAAELEKLGYDAIWVPGGIDDNVLEQITRLLDATSRITIATGIINIWKQTPEQVSEWWRGVADKDRVLLGFGVSHAPAIGERYRKPLEAMSAYLDGLDKNGFPVERRCLAALGPKMLDLARSRTLGAHPYLITPDHTAIARERLGPDVLLAPEQGVVVETDPAKARAIARDALQIYLSLPNYVNSWRRLGFTEEDVTQPSDRLIDALFAWGSVEQIAARIDAHFDAGADHVCLQVLNAEHASGELPLAEWRELAGLLTKTPA